MKVTSEMVLTAGPSITPREVEYAHDAAMNGWNHHHSDYLGRFEKAFAEYIGVGYAMATSSCTGALHLALLAMKVGPGDEVIVPETSWIATASAVRYTGATPVFADIDPDTWVMDCSQVEKLLTRKTKVIIPVHLYGNPVDMEPLLRLAEQAGISVLEDAAPSIGALYRGRKTGSFGRAAAFSFQGAKAMVTGEGGMFVTNDKELYDRVRFLGDHGRDPNRALAAVATGYKYKMSNLQAALGLAQTERIEEIVARKRQLFAWYSERLSDIDRMRMNVERAGTRNIYWMSSIVLAKDCPVQRDELMQKLRERMIDTRPFFYPMSSFPMYQEAKAQNPVAYDVPLRGVNLPSGHERTEEEIDYICAHLREVLGAKSSNKVSVEQPHGWLAYRDTVNAKLRAIKSASAGERDRFCLPLRERGKLVGRLNPVIASDADDRAKVELLAKWRDKVQAWFPAQFKVTYEGTKTWLARGVTAVKDRVLFFVEDDQNRPAGHVGLFRFDYKAKACEIDNIVRGEDGVFKGAIHIACRALLDWTFDELGIETAYLRVVSDNARAIALYEKLGYREIQRVPLQKVSEGDRTRWIEVLGRPYEEIQRYFVTMKLEKSAWMKVKAASV